MFRNLFNKSSQPKKKKADVVYKEYLFLLKEKLLPLGFDIKEGSGLGSFSTFKRENLEIDLVFELRDQETYLHVKSGKKVKFKTVFEQLPESIQKKASNIKEVEEQLVDHPDISLTLAGTDEEKDEFMKHLDEWLTEHS